jgi:cytochrome c-type biogenesis protein CcmE
VQSVVTTREDQLEAPSSARSPRRKKRLPVSFLLAGAAILGAIFYLVYANTQSNAVYYMTVSELMHCSTCATQDVRVAGVVQQGSIVRDDRSDRITFVINDGKQSLPVSYTGVVPDIFRAGAQVVVEGRYPGHGTFQADSLLTKCPSKFQIATPTAQ